MGIFTFGGIHSELQSKQLSPVAGPEFPDSPVTLAEKSNRVIKDVHRGDFFHLTCGLQPGYFHSIAHYIPEEKQCFSRRSRQMTDRLKEACDLDMTASGGHRLQNRNRLPQQLQIGLCQREGPTSSTAIRQSAVKKNPRRITGGVSMQISTGALFGATIRF